MTAQELRRVLIQQWWFIAACMVFAGLGAYVASRFSPALYESTVVMSVQISTANVNVVETLVAQEYVNSDVQLATSTPVLARVVPHYPGLSVARLQRNVSASAVSNSQLFDISVRDASPTRAAALANDLAVALIAQDQANQEAQHTAAEQPILQRIQSYQQLIDSLNASLRALPPTQSNASKIAALQSQLTQAKQTYGDWQATLMRAVESESVSTVALTIAEPALPSKTPAQPRLTVNVGAALIFGLLLALFLIVVRFRLDQRIRGKYALALLLGAPVLAEIGAQPAARAASADNPYGTLRRGLAFLNLDAPKRTIVIAGAQSTDGASVVAADLAIYLAQQGLKTLLVDANLHHPSQAERFGVGLGAGLSDAALAFSQSAHAPITPFIHHMPNHGLTQLAVMPAGDPPPDPTELLRSRTMGHVLSAVLAAGYQQVIFDAPAILDGLDARILAVNTDGVVLVVEPSRTRIRHINRVKSLLANANASVLGAVLMDRLSVQPMADSIAEPHGQHQDLEQSRVAPPDDMAPPLDVGLEQTAANAADGSNQLATLPGEDKQHD